MKALKLIIVFVIILLGIVGAFLLFSNDDMEKLPSPPDTTYQQFREQFEKEWEAAGDWNDSVFLKHVDLIRQLSVQYETTSLNDLNTMMATQIVYEKIFETWTEPSCKKESVDKYLKAIEVIVSKDSKAANNPSIDSIKRVDATYRDALKLANKTIGLTPTFNGDSWNSFSDYSSRVMGERNRMFQNWHYRKYLSNINEIKNGLNGYADKIAKAKDVFYKSLASKIAEHYGNIPREERNRGSLNKLRNIKDKYEQEYRSNAVLDNLSLNFANDVNSNESSN